MGGNGPLWVRRSIPKCEHRIVISEKKAITLAARKKLYAFIGLSYVRFESKRIGNMLRGDGGCLPCRP